MAESETVELNQLIDGQRVRPATVAFLLIALLMLISDGFDLAAMGFIAPELVKAWHVSPGALVPVFSAGILGLLVGGPLLGFIGDRIGRKRAALGGLCVVGVATLLTMAASSIPQFVVLRFITGVGLGGIIPNIIALAAELSPRRFRGTVIVIVNFGIPAGLSLPGLVAAGLMERFGWPVLLLVGGLLPLAIAGAGLFALPESIRFLAKRDDRDPRLRRLARVMRPDLVPSPFARFSAEEQTPSVASGSLRGLFAGGLAGITPLLWVALASNQMANFFALTWLPTLLQSMGASTAQAGVNASLFSIGGLAGGVLLVLLMDRLGTIPMMVLFFVGAPLVAAIGLPGLSGLEHGAVIAGAGFCVTGINFGMTAALGMIYPTPVRSVGIGAAHAAGRIGALAAPFVGGLLLASQASMQDLLLAPAGVLGVGALACVALAALCLRRFGGCRLYDFAIPRPPAPRLAAAGPRHP